MEINPVRKCGRGIKPLPSLKEGNRPPGLPEDILSNGIKIGCCGFPVGKDQYFKQFKVVELQQTFYQPPKLETVLRWKNQAPPEFEFSLKAWQLITHPATSPTYRRLTEKISQTKLKNCGYFKPTEEVYFAWEKTLKIVNTLEAKIIVFQCPASFIPTPENKQNLKKFFSSLKKRNFYFAWEVRGNWDKRDIKALCQDLDLIHCVDPFKDEPVYGRLNYFRLHGRAGYRYRYTERDLNELLKKIDKKKINYVMFNNVYMFEDALRFKEIVERLKN